MGSGIDKPTESPNMAGALVCGGIDHHKAYASEATNLSHFPFKISGVGGNWLIWNGNLTNHNCEYI